MADEKVLEKLRAILRKAEDSSGATSEEADTALRMAQRLMLKHGLTMQDVGELNQNPGRDFMRGTGIETNGVNEHWKGNLLFYIGSVYFCKVYYSTWGDNRRTWMIVGREDHVEMTRMMYDFIWPQIQREFNNKVVLMKQSPRYARVYAESVWTNVAHSLEDDLPEDDELAKIAKEHFETIRKERGPEEALRDIMSRTGLTKSYAAEVRAFVRKEKIAPAVTHNLGVWSRSFFDAAASRVRSRLFKMQREEAAGLGSSGKELVRDERAALDKYMEDIGLELGSGSSDRQTDYNGHSAGTQAGERADLSGHRKVSGTRASLGAGN